MILYNLRCRSLIRRKTISRDFNSKDAPIINEKIRAKEVRLIDDEGNNYGVVATSKAIKMADEKDLDLVVVSPNQSPPVAKIMDYGKYKYEADKRLIETLENIIEFRGNSQKIAVGRELTKKFEEIMCDTAENILNYYKQNTLKGEIAAVLYKSSNEKSTQYDAEVKKLLKENFSAKDIATIISTLYETNKKEIYNLAVKFKN